MDEKPLTEEELKQGIADAQVELKRLQALELLEKGVLYVCTACKKQLEEHSDQCSHCGDWDTIMEVKL